jgi:excisionase family DNA binding protein
MGDAAEKLEGIVVTTHAQLKKLVREALREELATATVDNSQQRTATLGINSKAAATYLGITQRTLTNYVKAGMPHHRPGRDLRFKTHELDEWSAAKGLRRRKPEKE